MRRRTNEHCRDGFPLASRVDSPLMDRPMWRAWGRMPARSWTRDPGMAGTRGFIAEAPTQNDVLHSPKAGICQNSRCFWRARLASCLPGWLPGFRHRSSLFSHWIRWQATFAAGTARLRRGCIAQCGAGMRSCHGLQSLPASHLVPDASGLAAVG